MPESAEWAEKEFLQQPNYQGHAVKLFLIFSSTAFRASRIRHVTLRQSLSIRTTAYGVHARVHEASVRRESDFWFLPVASPVLQLLRIQLLRQGKTSMI